MLHRRDRSGTRIGQIRYAEPIEVHTASRPASAKLATETTTRLIFDAFGRRFELELESNDRLLRRLPASRHAELPPHDLYRGALAGQAGSWVRLTRLPDGLYGAIWDGTEFYSIVPAHAAAEFMGGAAPRDSNRALIYRASDVEVPGGARFCAVVDPSGGSGKLVTGLDQYKALQRELPRLAASATATPTLELGVAMIADFEFTSLEPNPESALLSRLSVVDGIFSEQVGVGIVADELKAFDVAADPFTTSDAETLLDQVGRYRVATPAIAAAGLAHLVTGRDLTSPDPDSVVDDSVIGIAYLFGVCEADIGVSVSERLDPFTSGLVAAHEFGHNFGAPHDSEPESACRSTPNRFLMAPTLNHSSEFSQCSLDRMKPVVAVSDCLRVRQYPDVAVEVDPAVHRGYTGVPVPVLFDVVNAGTKAAESAAARIDLVPGLIPSSISASGGTCTVTAEDFSCEFASIPAGERRRVQFDVTATTPGQLSGSISVAVDGDVSESNNRGSFSLDINPAAAASIVAEPPLHLTVLNGSEFEISYRVNVAGIQSVQQASVRTTAADVVILAATAQSGTCTVNPSVTTCDLGTMAVGSSQRVTLRLRADRSGHHSIHHDLTVTPDDSDLSDNSSTVTLDVDAASLQTPSSSPDSGGGGALDWTSLVLGALGLGLCRRRRSPIGNAGRLHSGRCPDGSAIPDRGAGRLRPRDR